METVKLFLANDLPTSTGAATGLLLADRTYRILAFLICMSTGDR